MEHMDILKLADLVLQESRKKYSKHQIDVFDQGDHDGKPFEDIDFRALRDKGSKRDESIESDIDELDEKSRKKRPGSPAYYKGTRKSNKSMEREIKKCAKEPRPESCYDYWSADKQYDKAMKKEGIETLREVIREALEADIQEKKRKSGGLSEKIRKTLREKAKKANMPLGALTSVYRKGLAAWLSGHRQGVAQHQWAMARVNSFIRGGKARSVDKAEWKKVQKFRNSK